MASDGPSPHPPPLRLSLAAHQPSRRHPAQSLLDPSFHDPSQEFWTSHVSNPTPSEPPLSRRDDEQQHAVGSESALALRLYLAACNLSSSCRFWVLHHLFQFASIIALLLNHGNPIFEPLCVFLPSPLLPLLFWQKWTSALSPCLWSVLYYYSDSTMTFTSV